MIKYIVILLILTSFYLFPFGIKAQNKNSLPIKQILRVSPIILDVELKKGQNLYTINIDNLLNSALGIGINAQDFNPLEDESIQPNNNKNPLVDWTNIENPDILISPNQNKITTINIVIPKDAKNGGYSEVIFLTPIYNKQIEASSPTVLSRIGVLVLANLGKTNYNDLAKKTSVNFDFTKIFYENLPAEANFEIENKYFNHFSAKPFLTVTPLFGKPQTFNLEEKHVLPGQSRNWSEVLNPKTRSIFYSAKLAVSVGEGKQIFGNSYFFVFPIRAVLSILATLLLIVFVIFRRKQIKKAMQVLIRGK